jgi:hypothetical protein
MPLPPEWVGAGVYTEEGDRIGVVEWATGQGCKVRREVP